ncbi:carbohydrate-binding module family 43 protein, partial [Aureobasidium melanogenum]
MHDEFAFDHLQKKGSSAREDGNESREAKAPLLPLPDLEEEEPELPELPVAAAPAPVRRANSGGRLGSRLESGRSTEGTSAGALSGRLGRVVLVKNETKLLGRVAHAVSTVVAGGGVLLECARVSTTDVTEHISVCLFINAGLDGTAQRVEHALAEFPISRVSCYWYATLQGGCTDLLGLGGRGLALAAQAVPMAGQEAIVLVGEYEALLTPTVLVRGLEVHVDDTTRPNLSHVVTVKGTDLSPSSRALWILHGGGWEDEREENGNATPQVNVEGGVGAAIEVVGHVNTNGRVVRCSVTNTELSVTSILDVCLGVANSSLNESTGVGVGKSIDNGDVALVQVVVPGRVVTVDGLVGGGKVRHDVDASICEHVHAGIVVLGRINGVNTDCVGAQSLKVGNITCASRLIGQGVGVGRVGGVLDVLLVCDTAHEELGAVGLVEELGSLDDNGVDISSDLGDEHARGRDGRGNAKALHDDDVDTCLVVNWFDNRTCLALAAQAHLLAHLIIISPRSYFATTIRVRTTVWNMELTALFHFSLLPIPLPRAWLFLCKSFQLLLLLRLMVLPLCYINVLPFKPAILM